MTIRRLGALAAAALSASGLTGCITVPDIYAVEQAKPQTIPARNSDDKPAVEEHDLAKASFTDFFDRNCPYAAPAGEDAKAGPPTPAGGRAAACVDKVVTYAINQCVVKTGRQNHFAADVTKALAVSTIAAGVTADVVALSVTKSQDVLAAAAVAAATTNSGASLKSFVPSIAPAPIGVIIDTVPKYVKVAGLGDEAWTCAPDPQRSETDTVRTARCRAELTMKYARLHDAVLSMCGAGSF